MSETERMPPLPFQHLQQWVNTFANTVHQMLPQVESQLEAYASSPGLSEAWQNAELEFRRIEDRFHEVEVAMRMARKHLVNLGRSARASSERR
jgi:hypothetical protein